jgi:GTP-binding protein
MIIKKAEFHKSATIPEQFPGYPYPEFAFLGRSNSGKSSLISMIFDGKVKVKTSSSPGQTQTINFFTINDAVSIADLPGYGFAKAPGHIKDSLFPMIQSYLESRENLKIAFLLIDSRRDISPDDSDFLAYLSENGIPTAIVLTKTDKLSQSELHIRRKFLANELGIDVEDLYITSSTKKKGRKDLIDLIDENSVRNIME